MELGPAMEDAMQAYSDPKRENDPHALPDVEVFEAFYGDCSDCGQTVMSPDCRVGACHDCQDRVTRLDSQGWFWWSCFPGCMPDSDPVGPFATEAEALTDARQSAGLCEHGVPDDEVCEDCPAPELWCIENERGERLVFGWQSKTYRPGVSCWCSQGAAEKQAKALGVKGKAVRLPDAEARHWGK